jgi:hypothetical protein
MMICVVVAGLVFKVNPVVVVVAHPKYSGTDILIVRLVRVSTVDM